MSVRLDIPLEEMNGLARLSEEMVKLGSFCTVFSATEVLEKIRQGKKVSDIVKEGDKLKVKVLEINRDGKIRLSHKVLLEEKNGRTSR